MAEPIHVVIIGGGFAGLAAAKALRRADVRITMIDRRNHHLFQPLLYQVATAGLGPADIAEPLRGILRGQQNVMVRMAEVAAIDPVNKTLRMTPVPDADQTIAALQPTETMSFDKLIVAAGARHSYFGHDEWEVDAPGLKTLGDALEIRRKVLTAFERAEWTEDPRERAACTTFVVVGGGPTGVEMAGALAEIALETMRKDFRRVDTKTSRIVLVESGNEILTAYPEPLRQKGLQSLRKMGVHVQLGAPVTELDTHGVTLKDGTRIDAETVIWAAGVQGAPLAKSLGVPLDRAGRVMVQPDLSVPGHPDIFVTGDLAHVESDGKPVPGVAPAATQQGHHAAENLLADLAGRPRTPFRYFDKGSMATIGRSRAVLWSGPIQLHGFLAWLGWVFIHLLYLVNFRSRVVVFVKWAWAYLTFERSSRLIWQGEVRRPGATPSTAPASLPQATQAAPQVART